MAEASVELSNTSATLTRRRVSDVQRARLLSATIELVEQDGSAKLTVSRIVTRAGVSRKTFYDEFADCEACFLAAFERTFAAAHAQASAAYSEHASWREGMRAALTCLLGLIDSQPALARLCLVHSLSGGEAIQRRRDELMLELARTIDLGRQAGARRALPETTPEAVLGGVVAVLHRRLVRDDPRPVSDLLAPLMETIVLPYLGPAAAYEERRRRHRPRSSSAPRCAPPANDPLSGLKLRLTYRTVQVLVAIAERPGISNRRVAREAEISDEGQVSKLLARLCSLGLIENHGVGHQLGGANAWSLTATGRRIVHATRPRLLGSGPAA
ncbi:MAG TPA: TetR family transcriptional regulator [Solirubrobacteraceae bacterium]|jgi:AcrR family transcriptional regulator|nr:TetR family transcriptional regulator [Solirubrobacteraceae bacterium]